MVVSFRIDVVLLREVEVVSLSEVFVLLSEEEMVSFIKDEVFFIAAVVLIPVV